MAAGCILNWPWQSKWEFKLKAVTYEGVANFSVSVNAISQDADHWESSAQPLTFSGVLGVRGNSRSGSVSMRRRLPVS
jgi:hypothetical protein